MTTRRLRWVTLSSDHGAGTTKTRHNFEPFVYRARVEDVLGGTRTVTIEGQVASFMRRPRDLPRMELEPLDDRGHLIALQLGGPDDAANLVPMDRYTNRWGPWRRVEEEIVSLLGTGFGSMRVNVRYPDAVSLRPLDFTVGLQLTWGGWHWWQHFTPSSRPGVRASRLVNRDVRKGQSRPSG